MAESDTGTIHWFAPDPRAILPLKGFKVSRNLERLVRRGFFEVTRDRAFDAVIEGCAQRDDTWISDEIMESYSELHRAGHAHSVECWHDGKLAGGLYGVAIGGAFFGESMFHERRDASKVALVHLVNHLRTKNFVLLDTQFSTPHLAGFGAIEIGRDEYEKRLQNAIDLDVTWQ